MSRRAVLGNVAPSKGSTHPGLWLAKYLKTSDPNDKEAKRALVGEVAGLGEPRGYGEFFGRYRQALAEAGASLREAQVLDRLVVGLGAEGVLEVSLTLHHTYGVPVIPGSALKGLASRFAATRFQGEAWRRNLVQTGRGPIRGEAQRALFGDLEAQGLVVFFDALPLPGYRIRPDLMNPHHPGYYTGPTDPPADWDEPVPVPFLSVEGTFLIALGLAPGVPKEAGRPWLDLAWEVLAQALREEGVGAKTTSGYGRLALREAKGETPSTGPSPALQEVLARIRGTSYAQAPRVLPGLAPRILALPEGERGQALEAIRAKKLHEHPDLKGARRKSPELDQLLKELGA